MSKHVNRRDALKTTAGAAALFLAGATTRAATAQEEKSAGKLKFGVTRGYGRQMSLDDFCVELKKMGLVDIGLVGPNDWATLTKHGLSCSVGNGAGMGLSRGFNDLALHDELVAGYMELLPKAAEAGVRSVICFSGNRSETIDDETGLKNCVIGLKRLMPIAEKLGVTMIMELLNSRVNHPGYQCDHTAWGVEMCKQIGSPRMQLLYDIYHMQIMEGDIIRTIQNSIEYIDHFHIAGNPGRHEPDDTQEIYYPAVMRAIAALDFDGYINFEFSPADRSSDRIEVLKQAYEICNV